MTESRQTSLPAFRELGLSEPVLAALEQIGYEVPSPIQARTIPHIVAGSDVVGQAQTGTGKTAAFALPLLSRPGAERRPVGGPKVLVLVPTRELAIQVAEAFHKYAARIPGFMVLPVYGGQGYTPQLRQLQRGVHVVVGTPGRLTDHVRRGTLDLSTLECMVIDEADEMLRMGFIEEVEWLLQQAPPTRQVALFSATMPDAIRRIANGYLRSPVEITIQARTTTASTIHQRYWMVSGLHKLDALTRILEGETFDAILVFVRTKTSAVELAEKLAARGFACSPLNGDIPQAQREATVEKLRNGELDILVATDVAARGLDVQRISHVVNYDIPSDTESYIHRIGRTGRAGRPGEAILFVAPRERRLLHSIEKATNQRIELMQLPSPETVNDIRVSRFKQRITDTLAEEELGFFYQLVEEYRQEHNIPALEIAAALARLVQGDMPLLLKQEEPPPAPVHRAPAAPPWRDARENIVHGAPPQFTREDNTPGQYYRLDVGRTHGAQPGQIVGAIANEGGLQGRDIRQLNIHDDHTTVMLPAGLPQSVQLALARARVAGRPLALVPLDVPPPARDYAARKKAPFKKHDGAPPKRFGGAAAKPPFAKGAFKKKRRPE